MTLDGKCQGSQQSHSRAPICPILRQWPIRRCRHRDCLQEREVWWAPLSHAEGKPHIPNTWNIYRAHSKHVKLLLLLVFLLVGTIKSTPTWTCKVGGVDAEGHKKPLTNNSWPSATAFQLNACELRKSFFGSGMGGGFFLPLQLTARIFIQKIEDWLVPSTDPKKKNIILCSM